MGVPKFFRWLSERYPKINQPIHCPYKPIHADINGGGVNINSNSESNTNDGEGGVDLMIDDTLLLPEFDHLYMDMNGIIHGCSHNNGEEATNPNLEGSNKKKRRQRSKSILDDDDYSDDISLTSPGNAPSSPPKPITEDEIVANVCTYVHRVIADIVKPKKVIYMAIDGVAPRAKLNQQRSRRFRNQKEVEIKAQMMAELSGQTQAGGTNGKGKAGLDATSDGGFVGRLETHENTPVDEEAFSSNVITPGTPFLTSVSAKLQQFVQTQIDSGHPAYKDVRIIFSGANVPGEGEHKIMDFIRREKVKEGYDVNTRHCLLGQDGDLIMLALATHEPHFCLLREEVLFGERRTMAENSGVNAVQQYVQNTNFELLHLSILRDYLALEFGLWDTLRFGPQNSDQNNETTTTNKTGDTDSNNTNSNHNHNTIKFDLERTIDDFVFLTFLIGNDFLPHMPALDIADGAFDLLFHTYKKHRYQWSLSQRDTTIPAHLSSPYLVTNGELSKPYTRLENFFSDIGRHEDPYYDRKNGSSHVKRENERIRAADKKHGRLVSSIPSEEELESLEEERRGNYDAMMEKVMEQGDLLENFKPVLSGGVPMGSGSGGGVRMRKKLREEEERRKKEVAVDEGIVSQLGSLLRASLSPLQTEATPTTAGPDTVLEDASSDDDEDEDPATQDLKGRYYYDKFEFTPLDRTKHRQLRQSYIAGLQWCLRYYYKGCPSWEWYYPYHYGPMISDLANDLGSYVRANDGIPATNNRKDGSSEGGSDGVFPVGVPLKPFEQLLGCMPPSSASVLPSQYQWLMTSPSSPVIDYYPDNFMVDLNGKKQPWEAVALLPFIDSQRLLSAVRENVTESELSAEDLKRNAFGVPVEMGYDEESGGCVTTLLPVEYPTSTASTITPMECFPSLLHPQTTIPHPCGQYPTLSSAPIHSIRRKKVGINLFGSPSRYLTALLHLDTGSLFSPSVRSMPPLSKLSDAFLGTSVYIAYPHLREGYVTSLSDGIVSIRGGALEAASGAATSEGPGKAKAKATVLKHSEREMWRQKHDALIKTYVYGNGSTGSGGWIVPEPPSPSTSDTPNNNSNSNATNPFSFSSSISTYKDGNNILLSVRPLKGLHTLPDGRIVKRYHQWEMEVPLTSVMFVPHYPDSRFGVPAMLELNPYRFGGESVGVGVDLKNGGGGGTIGTDGYHSRHASQNSNSIAQSTKFNGLHTLTTHEPPSTISSTILSASATSTTTTTATGKPFLPPLPSSMNFSTSTSTPTSITDACDDRHPSQWHPDSTSGAALCSTHGLADSSVIGAFARRTANTTISSGILSTTGVKGSKSFSTTRLIPTVSRSRSGFATTRPLRNPQVWRNVNVPGIRAGIPSCRMAVGMVCMGTTLWGHYTD